MHALLIALVLLQQPPDRPPEIDGLLRDFAENMRKARTPDEIRVHAKATQEKLEALAKEGKYAALATFHAAEMCMFQDDAAGAIARFKQSIDKGLSKEFLPNARYLTGELCLQEDDFAGARTWLGEFAKHHADEERAFQARALAELSYVIEGKVDAGLAGLGRLREEHKGRPQEWQAVAATAAAHHYAEQNEKAREAFEEMASKCPNVRTAEMAKRLLADFLHVGKPAKLTAKDADGREVDIEKLRGRVVVVHFFTIGYDRAPAETVALKRTLKACEGKDVSAVSVCIDRRKEDMERFRKDLAMTWPVVHDGNHFDGPLAKQLGVRDLPWVLVIDRKGTVRFLNPFLTMACTELRHLVEKLLAEKQ